MAKKAPRKPASRKARKSTAKPRKKASKAKRSAAPKRRTRTARPAKRAAAPKSATRPKAATKPTRVPALDRERRRLPEVEGNVPTPPSSLNPDRLHPSAARSGRSALRHARREHTETSPQLTGGDVDADWEEAYAVGDEAPGGDNPTPDQDRVDDIGRALGIEYADNEELKSGDKIAERDKHRWELDPASAEDYPDHDEE
jgi:Family of unknown function (DUF6335)